MGLKHLPTKTKEKNFDISSRNNDKYKQDSAAQLGSPKRPLKLVVISEEKRAKLQELCDENNWTHRIKVKPNQVEDLTDLVMVQERSHTTETKEHHIGRNDPCHCGSGKKYKKCCLPK